MHRARFKCYRHVRLFGGRRDEAGTSEATEGLDRAPTRTQSRGHLLTPKNHGHVGSPLLFVSSPLYREVGEGPEVLRGRFFEWEEIRRKISAGGCKNVPLPIDPTYPLRWIL